MGLLSKLSSIHLEVYQGPFFHGFEKLLPHQTPFLFSAIILPTVPCENLITEKLSSISLHQHNFWLLASRFIKLWTY